MYYCNFFLAKGFVQCKLSDPAISECMRNELQRATPYLSKGKTNLKHFNQYFVLIV